MRKKKKRQEKIGILVCTSMNKRLSFKIIDCDSLCLSPSKKRMSAN